MDAQFPAWKAEHMSHFLRASALSGGGACQDFASKISEPETRSCGEAGPPLFSPRFGEFLTAFSAVQEKHTRAQWDTHQQCLNESGQKEGVLSLFSFVLSLRAQSRHLSCLSVPDPVRPFLGWVSDSALLSLLLDEAPQLSKIINRKSAKIQRLQENVSELGRQARGLTADVNNRDAEIGVRSAKIRELEAALGHKTGKSPQKDRELAALRREVQSLTTTLQCLQAEKDSLTSQVSTLNEANGSLNTRINDLTLQRTDLANRLEEVQAELSRARAERLSVEKHLSSAHEREADIWRRQIQKSETEWRLAHRSHSVNSLKSIQQLQAKFSDEVGRLKAEYEAKIDEIAKKIEEFVPAKTPGKPSRIAADVFESKTRKMNAENRVGLARGNAGNLVGNGRRRAKKDTPDAPAGHHSDSFGVMRGAATPTQLLLSSNLPTTLRFGSSVHNFRTASALDMSKFAFRGSKIHTRQSPVAKSPLMEKVPLEGDLTPYPATFVTAARTPMTLLINKIGRVSSAKHSFF